MVRVLVEELKDPERGDFVNAGDTQGITAVFLALQKGVFPHPAHLEALLRQLCPDAMSMLIGADHMCDLIREAKCVADLQLCGNSADCQPSHASMNCSETAGPES